MKNLKRIDTRHKSKLKRANIQEINIQDFRHHQSQKQPIGYLLDNEYPPKRDDENLLDAGDPRMMASMNDFIKGYNINPYEFRIWANTKHKKKYASMMKKGSGEVFVMQFSPEFLADRILTLWNKSSGPLQKLLL